MSLRNTKKLIVLLGFLLSAANLSAQSYPFVSFTVENGLPQSQVYSILQSSDGFLWLGSQGGLTKFDGQKFVNYSTDDGLSANWVWCMTEDKDGKLWLGTNYGGISIYDGNSFQTIEMKDGLLNNSVRALYIDSHEKMWIGTNNGVNIIENGKISTFDLGENPSQIHVYDFYEDLNSNLWIASSNGLYLFDGTDLKHFIQDDYKLKTNTIWDISQGTNGVLWFSSAKGVTRYDGEKWDVLLMETGLSLRNMKIIHIDKDVKYIASRRGLLKYSGNKISIIDTKKGLVNDIVNTIYEDKEGNVWIGTRGGLSKFMTSEAILAYNKNSGLNADIVNSIVKYGKEEFLFGSPNGVFLLRKNGFENFDTPEAIKNSSVRRLFIDSDKNIWIGTNKGLFKKTNSRWKEYNFDDAGKNVINDIKEDAYKAIWIATRNGVFSIKNDKLISFNKEDGMISNVTRSIAFDKNGIMYVSTLRGLSIYGDGKWRNLTTADGLAGDSIVSIFIDSNENIWLGSRRGVSKYDGKTFTNITSEAGLSNNVCRFITELDGAIFVGTGNGLNRIVNDRVERIYYMNDGFPSSEFTQNSVMRDGDSLWLGTNKGAAKFSPKNDSKSSIAPDIHITGVKQHDIKLVNSDYYEFNYDENYIAIDFVGIILSSNTQMQYKYTLEGLDDKWRYTKQNIIYFASLPAGEYQFKVMAENYNGIWSENPAVVSFVIHPAFWNTWWFRLFIFLNFIGAITFKVSRLIKEKKFLTSRIKYKTGVIEEQDKTIQKLEGLLPICSKCKKIRDDSNADTKTEWVQIERYISDRTAAHFTHGICPECYEGYIDELEDMKNGN